MRGEIGAVDRAADPCDRSRETLTDVAAVERVGAVARERLECHGQVPLLEHLAGAGPATARTEDLRGLLVLGDAVTLFGDRLGEHVAHGEAVLGVADRGGERAIEAEAAVVGEKIGEPGDESGHGRDRGTLARELRAEALGVEGVRRGARTVVRGHLARPRVVEQREHIAADRGAMRHDHGADRGSGDGGIGGVAAFAESGETSGRREVMSARDQTVRGSDRAASRQQSSMVLKGRTRSRCARPQLRPPRCRSRGSASRAAAAPSARGRARAGRSRSADFPA